MFRNFATCDSAASAGVDVRRRRPEESHHKAAHATRVRRGRGASCRNRRSRVRDPCRAADHSAASAHACGALRAYRSRRAAALAPHAQRARAMVGRRVAAGRGPSAPTLPRTRRRSCRRRSSAWHAAHQQPQAQRPRSPAMRAAPPLAPSHGGKAALVAGAAANSPQTAHQLQQLAVPALAALPLEQQQLEQNACTHQKHAQPVPRDARRREQRCASGASWARGRDPCHAAAPTRRLAAMRQSCSQLACVLFQHHESAPIAGPSREHAGPSRGAAAGGTRG